MRVTQRRAAASAVYASSSSRRPSERGARVQPVHTDLLHTRNPGTAALAASAQPAFSGCASAARTCTGQAQATAQADAAFLRLRSASSPGACRGATLPWASLVRLLGRTAWRPRLTGNPCAARTACCRPAAPRLVPLYAGLRADALTLNRHACNDHPRSHAALVHARRRRFWL